MGYQSYTCGYKRITSSGAVGDVGKPALFCGYGVESGATAAVPYINNGGALVGSDIVFRPGPNTISQGNVAFPSCFPISFPTGIWVSFDANTTAVTVFYVQNT